ncbi:tRNA dimethylallyltransferase 1 [Spirochaetia bacterium]|nr:tRNA dimethylallyltransferase 1 [Spirochaetia bacterium]
MILCGPTASGKTDLIEKTFRNGGAEVVSADSMQVYRGLNIGTAKPAPSLRALIPHYLIDICDPDEQWTVGDFVQRSTEICNDIITRGLVPVVSGGTGFYIKHFVCGLPETPPSDAETRLNLREEVKKKGIEPLLKELEAIDPVSASRIHRNNTQRLLRALEVGRITGKPLSSYISSGTPPHFDFSIIGIDIPRMELYRRIDERCAAMFRNGLEDEVRELARAGYTPHDPALRGIGYREFFEEPEPGVFCFAPNTTGIQALVAQHTRNYAKRQLTFFRSIPDIQWITPEL